MMPAIMRSAHDLATITSLPTEVQPEQLNLEKALALFESLYMASRNLAPRTRVEYRGDLKQVFDFLAERGITKPAAVGLSHLQAFLAHLDTKGYAGVEITFHEKIGSHDVTATKIKLFVFMGVISAFAAILLTLEMINFWTTQGAGLLLPTIAAVFIGGTSIAGGYGTVIGSFFGAYIVGSLEAGVVASGIGGYWTRLVTGLVMGSSVVLNIILHKEKGKGLGEKLRESVFLKGFSEIKNNKFL